MKTLTKYLLIFIFGFVSFSGMGQSEPKKGDFSFYVEVGASFFGPTSDMYDHMIATGFDHTYYHSWLGRTLVHPREESYSPALGFGFTSQISKNSKFGLSFQHKKHGSVNGENTENDWVTIHFRTIQVTPEYHRTLNKLFELKLGLPILFNGSGEYGRGSIDYIYEDMSVGALFGLNFIIKESEKLYWKFAADAIITYANEVGEFGAGIYDQTTLPASEINFSHMNFKFIMGFK